MQEKNSAILFDLDGTLLNSGKTFHKIVNLLKKERRQDEVPFEKVRKYSSRGASLILRLTVAKICSIPYIGKTIMKFLSNFIMIEILATKND